MKTERLTKLIMALAIAVLTVSGARVLYLASPCGPYMLTLWNEVDK